MTIPDIAVDTKPTRDGSPHPASVAMGARIRAAREAVRWSQMRLAVELGVTQVAVSRYENGHRDVSALHLTAIARVLDVPLSTLLEDAPATFEGAYALAQRIRAVLRETVLNTESTHDYLSTGCLHGDMVLPDGRTGHEYCRGETGTAGAKTPAQCKFCSAPCRCACHEVRP